MKEKFVPYIVDSPVDMGNGIVVHKRKKYRTKTVYDWMAPCIEYRNYIIQWCSVFDHFSLSEWKEGYLANILTGKTEIPLEYHYGNCSIMFLFNMLKHFNTKDVLLANIDRWSNYYRKHVTDTLSGYSANLLYASVMLQRAGLTSNIKQQYIHHSLEEIESSDIKEYYYFRYEVKDDYITFYCNPIYKTMPSVKITCKA